MISSPGVGSGLDIPTLITGLLNVERAPLNRLNSRKNDVQVEISANGKLKGAISQLQVAAQALDNRTTLTGVKAVSSDPLVFTASGDSTAVQGSHTLVISQLAQQHTLISTAYATADTAIGSGTLDITVGATTLNLNLAAGSNTLNQISDAINQSATNPGVSASIITVNAGAKLVLTANDTGLANAISVTVDPALSGFAVTQLNPAQDATLTVDGFAVTRAANSFSDVIQGVTLNLASVGSATLNLQPDSTALSGAIDAFVNSFNALRGTIKALRNGALRGDSTLLGIEKTIRDQISGGITIGAANPAFLSELGISFQKTGDLSLDKTKLTGALNKDVGHVLDLLSASNAGIGGRVDSYLNAYMKTDGILDTRNLSLTQRSSHIDGQIINAQFRLSKIEARLRKEFTALDQLLAGLQTTGNFLTQQLSNLPGSGRGRN